MFSAFLKVSLVKQNSFILMRSNIWIYFCFYSSCVFILFMSYLRRDFPGGPVVKNLCQCREHRFNPWSGRISHATGHLSLCSATRKAITMRSPCATTKTQYSQKKNLSQSQGHCEFYPMFLSGDFIFLEVMNYVCLLYSSV